jgi:hypothetical protein
MLEDWRLQLPPCTTSAAASCCGLVSLLGPCVAVLGSCRYHCSSCSSVSSLGLAVQSSVWCC